MSMNVIGDLMIHGRQVVLLGCIVLFQFQHMEQFYY
jgi:hypothetical protein